MAGQIQETLLDVNAAEFFIGLDEAIQALEIHTRRQLQQFGVRVANAAKRYCPSASGRLRGSIGAESGMDAEGFYVDVGTDVEYGPFVEFGTRKMRAQPFMRPALAEASGYFGQTILGGGEPLSTAA
jgi:HK97 gp10 family phage protein